MSKKIVNKTKKKLPRTAIFFSNIIIQKDSKNLEKSRPDSKSRLKKICNQENIGLIDNEDLNENHLDIKKLHLNMKNNTLFAKNLLNFIEGNWNFKSERDNFKEENSASHDSTVLQSDVKESLKNICISNINKLIFGHLNVNSLRNKFDFVSVQIKSSIDIFMVSETKLHDSFLEGQFLKVFIHHLDLTIIEMVEELCFTYGKISQSIVNPWFLFCGKLFYWDQLAQKEMPFNPHKSDIGKHLDIISISLDPLSTKNENIVFIGDFNARIDDEAL